MSIKIPKNAIFLSNKKFFRINNEFQETEILLETDYYNSSNKNKLFLSVKEKFNENFILNDEYFRFNNVFQNYCIIQKNMNTIQTDKIIVKYGAGLGSLNQNNKMFLEIIQAEYPNDKIYMI